MLPAGGSAQVIITVVIKPTQHGTLTNVATVTGGQPNHTPGKARGTSRVHVTRPVVARGAPPSAAAPAQPLSDLVIVKHASLRAAYPGERIHYTLRVANVG